MLHINNVIGYWSSAQEIFLDNWYFSLNLRVTITLIRSFINSGFVEMAKIASSGNWIKQMAEVLLLVHSSCVFCEKFNLTDLLREKFFSARALQDISVTGDASYLPEDDYLDDSQETWSNDLEQLQRNDRNLMPQYHNLCETVTRKVQLDDSEFEYQPPHYHEVFCKGYPMVNQNQRINRSFNQKCAHPSFHCVQRSRTLFVLRRRWQENCWEPFTKEVASGCDCMWPTSILGDIAPHY